MFREIGIIEVVSYVVILGGFFTTVVLIAVHFIRKFW
jgi:hypothetical protein